MIRNLRLKYETNLDKLFLILQYLLVARLLESLQFHTEFSANFFAQSKLLRFRFWIDFSIIKTVLLQTELRAVVMWCCLSFSSIFEARVLPYTSSTFRVLEFLVLRQADASKTWNMFVFKVERVRRRLATKIMQANARWCIYLLCRWAYRTQNHLLLQGNADYMIIILLFNVSIQCFSTKSKQNYDAHWSRRNN